MAFCNACNRICRNAGTRVPYCAVCKGLMVEGRDRVEAENLSVDQAGGSWWAWDKNGNVVAGPRFLKGDLLIELGGGDVYEDDEDDD